MSLVIFFGMAFFIFLGGMTLITVTFYHWYKLAKEAKIQNKKLESLKTSQ